MNGLIKICMDGLKIWMVGLKSMNGWIKNMNGWIIKYEWFNYKVWMVWLLVNMNSFRIEFKNKMKVLIKKSEWMDWRYEWFD